MTQHYLLSEWDIIIITADQGAPSMDQIRADLPGQFINVGIAEQNAIVVGAGLAMRGKKVFIHAIASFITLRCLEQIRLMASMMEIPLNIVGVGAGIGYESSGPTHHLLEDLAVIRAFPGIEINSITDSVMAGIAVDHVLQSKSAHYVRLERKKLPDLYRADHDFSTGLARLRDGKNVVIVSTGIMTHEAIALSEKFSKDDLSAGVVDIFKLPIDPEELSKALSGVEVVVTLEEHFLPGGLGGAVCEALQDAGRLIPVHRLGFGHDKSYCYTYGGRDLIRQHYGLGAKQLEDKIRKIFVGLS